jgi:hypothetical protein
LGAEVGEGGDNCCGCLRGNLNGRQAPGVDVSQGGVQKRRHIGDNRPSLDHSAHHSVRLITDALSARNGGVDEGLAAGRQLGQLADRGDAQIGQCRRRG